ncbi:MAG: hypothetical protein ACE5HD_02225 [Acidobacteriota bacterium]
MDFLEVEKRFIRRTVLADFDWVRFAAPTEPRPLSRPVTDCRVALVVTAGAYLTAIQEPFQIRSPVGNDSYRVIPAEARAEEIALSHSGYDTRGAR